MVFSCRVSSMCPPINLVDDTRRREPPKTTFAFRAGPKELCHIQTSNARTYETVKLSLFHALFSPWKQNAHCSLYNVPVFTFFSHILWLLKDRAHLWTENFPIPGHKITTMMSTFAQMSRILIFEFAFVCGGINSFSIYLHRCDWKRVLSQCVIEGNRSPIGDANWCYKTSR